MANQELEYNPDLLPRIPKDAAAIIEVGCSDGGLAKAYKAINPDCHYTGIELNPEAAKLAETYCDDVLALNIESADDSFFAEAGRYDCWIFGDVLEHLVDPWSTLLRIRKVISPTGRVLACIPNMQHWSIQARLCAGDLTYERSSRGGLLDVTHLRWFTRATMLTMFQETGFDVADIRARIFEEPAREQFLKVIRLMAEHVCRDVEVAVQDATPAQYIIQAVPSRLYHPPA